MTQPPHPDNVRHTLLMLPWRIVCFIGRLIRSLFVIVGVVAALAVLSMALSALRIFVARSIQRFARWAYVVAVVLTFLGSFPYLLGWLDQPYEAGSLSASLHTFRVWVNLVMLFGAVALLVMSFIRRDPSLTDAPDARPMPPPAPPVAERAPDRPLIESAAGRVAFRDPPPDDRP